jgi:gamma-polyglutamate synthase
VTAPLLGIDPLRERLAAPELAEARRVLAQSGVAGLVARAHREIAVAQAARDRFDAFCRSIEGCSPNDRSREIERYLKDVADDPARLAADLRALRRGRGVLLDLPALGERIAHRESRAERAAEVTLALARAALTPEIAATIDAAPILALARAPGRWSRRAEALGLLGRIAPHTSGDRRSAIAEISKQLTDRAEQRWVQPAALAVLAAVDPDGAKAVARERLASPGGGDDFLVRSRIVELIARLQGAGWSDLLAVALDDPSDLVRMTAARVERAPGALERRAQEDPSHKVRAVALIMLAKRAGRTAQTALVNAVASDAHGFVVQTAAEELVALARKGRIAADPTLLRALAHGAGRADVAPQVRARCREALAEIDVLCTPLLRATHDALESIVVKMPVGGATRIADRGLARVPDEQLGRVLSVLSREDHALGVDRTADGVILYRGEVRALSPWRILFELLHPAPSKRQAFNHTWARRPRGALRAPPGGMAELTATRVPGERVFIDRIGEWGRHLPLVDDLLSTGIVFPRKVALASARGVTTIVAPASITRRLGAFWKLTVGYPRFVDLRRRALESDEPATQTAYLAEIASATGIAVQTSSHAFGVGKGEVELPLPDELVVASPARASVLPSKEVTSASFALLGAPALRAVSDALAPARDVGYDFLRYAVSPGGNRLPHLAGYALAILGGLLVRNIAIRRSIEKDRSAMPLVIGGWGTRGKSGTERLKAGLFQGLGHECLVKTTGCEAMFIHAIPGVPAREIFIYRPYEKATIWEQRDVLALAGKLGARVFLWECMALQPDLVNLLQSQWMRDDFSTITNAYPDHEDVQGPAGLDVATVISEFVPSGGKLFTAEDQMLPLLREKAKERGTALRVVGARDAELISDDLLARFPYQEHPKNIALVASLSRALGIPTTVAIAEMADHVVPDLGVLKTYPTVPWRGRTLSFTNGMSANERTGALANFRRTDFDKHDPDIAPSRWIVMVVNNRADRLARSEVFARFLVEDIAAHRHVLIGTNVGGLVGFLREALDRHLEALAVTKNLVGDADLRRQTAAARIERAFARLVIGRLDAASVRAEGEALGFPELPSERVERLLEPARPGEPFSAAKSAVAEALRDSIDGERAPFLVAMIARRRAVRAVLALLPTSLEANPASVDAAFCAAYRALFEEGMIPLADASLTGDQILDRVAKSVPPGAHASIMGVQNIKGTGLDFVYRWVSIDMVARALDSLGSPSVERRREALRNLMVHDDYGLLDATLALAKLEEAPSRDPDDAVLRDAVMAKLREVVAARTQRLTSARTSSILDRLRALTGEMLDFLDAVKRRRLATRLLESLVEGRVSHASAAIAMREIVARTKGAWMKAGL